MVNDRSRRGVALELGVGTSRSKAARAGDDEFVLRMAARETRASWRRLLFFFVCIAVGVAAIVALRSVIQSVRGVFGREAKSLIAADVLISTNRDWTARGAETDRSPPLGVRRDRPHRNGRDADDGRGRRMDAAVARMVELRAVQPAVSRCTARSGLQAA